MVKNLDFSLFLTCFRSLKLETLSLLIQAMHYFQIDKVRQHVSALVAGGASDM